jgi:nucleotide-binding universal stress UspA family protein
MFARIVVGTDGSETAKQAVREATELAKQTGATLYVVSAFDPVPSARLREERLEAPADIEHTVNPNEDVDAILSDAAKEVEQQGVQVQTVARQGEPADAILDVAEDQNADLIVVGNKGMTGAKRFLLGSVPNKVSHHAPSSVLIVRTT